MSWFARLMYGALVWKERQRARRLRAAGAGQPAAEHLETGERGELLAYWFLRRSGYTIVARNRRARSGRGEIDLIGWDGPVLAFIEVKSRTSLEGGPPEAAVSRAKRKRIVHAARDYLKRLRRKDVNYRYDVVSVLWDPDLGLTARLTKDAFKE